MDKFKETKTSVILTNEVRDKAKKIAKRETGKPDMAKGIRIAVMGYKK